MKKLLCVIIFWLTAFVAFCQTNAIITQISADTDVSTTFWPTNTLVYNRGINQWRLITDINGWPNGVAFSTVTSIHADPPDMTGTNPTQLAGITNAGSGQIITDAERTKLQGIEAGAEVNVNADWNAVSGDARILNKPTIFDTENVQDIIGAMVTGNTETGITVTYDDATGKLNFNVTSMLTSPQITSFEIDGQSTTVPLNTTISGAQTFNYSVSNSGNVTGDLTLSQDAVNLSTTVPATGTSVVQTVNSITLVNENDNTVFQLSGADIDGATFSRTFTITAVGQDEFLYIDLTQDSNPVNVDISAQDVQGIEITGPAQSGTFSVGPIAANDFIIILAPNDHDLTFLANNHFPTSNILSTFTRTASVRTIAGQVYNSYVLGPLNPGFTQTYNFTLN